MEIYVIKIGGEIIKSKKSLHNVLKYTKNLLSQNIKVVIVHGGGPQADHLSKVFNHIPTKINGRRVTSEKDLEIIKMLYGGTLNIDILSAMKKFQLHGMRVSGLDGNLMSLKKRTSKEFDFGFVADIKKINPEILLNLLEKNIIPVISPIGCDKKGIILNINADTISNEVAKSLKATKLIFFTEIGGIYKNENLIQNLSLKECKNLIKEKIVTGGMLVKVENIIENLKSGIKEIQILNTSKKNFGTTIVKNFPPFIYHFIGDKKGPVVTIMGSIHGNEKIGKKIIDKLKKDLKNQEINGEIFLIFANPVAYRKNVRFVDEDLNRLFGTPPTTSFLRMGVLPPLDKGRQGGVVYEQKRALEIKEILKKTDFLLDIHSTQKPSVPFIYLENSKKHLKLAKLFQSKYLVSLSKNFDGKELICSADNFVDKNGGLGLTYETGFHTDFSDFENVYLKTKLFLKKVNSSFFNSALKCGVEIAMLPVEIFQSIKPKTNNFKFTKDFSNFDFVKKGEIIAFDGNKKIIAPEDIFIIFPKKEFFINKTACYLASQIPLTPFHLKGEPKKSPFI